MDLMACSACAVSRDRRARRGVHPCHSRGELVAQSQTIAFPVSGSDQLLSALCRRELMVGGGVHTS